MFVRRCDQCGKETSLDGLTITMQQGRGEIATLHFCRDWCYAGYVANKANLPWRVVDKIKESYEEL